MARLSIRVICPDCHLQQLSLADPLITPGRLEMQPTATVTVAEAEAQERAAGSVTGKGVSPDLAKSLCQLGSTFTLTVYA